MKLHLVIFILSTLNEIYSQENAPRVKTPLGGIKGYYKVSHGGRKFEAYEGIPYALPPVGKLRFKVNKNYLNILFVHNELIQNFLFNFFKNV